MINVVEFELIKYTLILYIKSYFNFIRNSYSKKKLFMNILKKYIFVTWFQKISNVEQEL